MNSLLLGFALTCASLSLAAGVSAADAIIDIDQTFVKLDIATVISQRDDFSQCGVQNAQIVYLDHSNSKHIFNYLVQGNCPHEN
jgi:hypothetical protein